MDLRESRVLQSECRNISKDQVNINDATPKTVGSKKKKKRKPTDEN